MAQVSGKKIKKFLAYFILAGAIFLPGAVKCYRLSAQKAQNHARLKALMHENSRLTEENKKLKEDPVYIEKTAREDLGLAKKGEVVVKFKDDVSPRPQR